jgi:hypothetical protein
MEGRVTIDADEVEAIARRVAELVGQPSRVTAATPNRGHERRKAPVTGPFEERLKGLEPSTFCMASRP